MEQFATAFLAVFIDIIGPVVLVASLFGGAAGATWLFMRSRIKQEMRDEIATYSEALKDTASALKTSNETLSQTQNQLRSVHQTTINQQRTLAKAEATIDRMKETINTLRVELENERKQKTDRQDELSEQVTSLRDEVRRLKAQLDQKDFQIEQLQERLATSEENRELANAARIKSDLELDALKCQIDDLRKQLNAAPKEGFSSEQKENPDSTDKASSQHNVASEEVSQSEEHKEE